MTSYAVKGMAWPLRFVHRSTPSNFFLGCWTLFCPTRGSFGASCILGIGKNIESSCSAWRLSYWYSTRRMNPCISRQLLIQSRSIRSTLLDGCQWVNASAGGKVCWRGEVPNAPCVLICTTKGEPLLVAAAVRWHCIQVTVTSSGTTLHQTSNASESPVVMHYTSKKHLD